MVANVVAYPFGGGAVSFVPPLFYPGDDGDIPITGGQSFIISARAESVAKVTGEAWDNVSGALSAAPPTGTVGLEASERTPVLAIHGAGVDELVSQRKSLVPLAT